MLYIPGQKALSAFRTEKLQTKIQALGLSYVLEETQYEYYLETSGELNAEMRARLTVDCFNRVGGCEAKSEEVSAY